MLSGYAATSLNSINNKRRAMLIDMEKLKRKSLGFLILQDDGIITRYRP